ncbi:MAG: DUF1080 domain-containing protein [Salinibacter sp.]
MKTLLTNAFALLLVVGLSAALCADAQAQQNPPEGDGWVSLFDGKTLDGWRASENEETFSVDDGRIVADGPRSHLFYTGSVANHNFDDFELRVDVMTKPGSNSGIYFHTQYQEKGWPSQGYEAQINNSYESDPRKTGSLYAVEDVKQSPVGDNEWFTMAVRVEGDHIEITVDGETTAEYTEPDDAPRKGMEGRVLSGGTIALQGHDPESTVYFKNIYIRPLK